nr:MAG TPA: hypothetical protein [Caudoviricetes sp.]
MADRLLFIFFNSVLGYKYSLLIFLCVFIVS